MLLVSSLAQYEDHIFSYNGRIEIEIMCGFVFVCRTQVAGTVVCILSEITTTYHHALAN